MCGVGVVRLSCVGAVRYCTAYCTALYCAVLYGAVLYGAVLCCVVLCCVELCCAVCCTVLCCVFAVLCAYPNIMISSSIINTTNLAAEVSDTPGTHAS